MTEKRTLKRHHSIFYLNTTEKYTNKEIGRLVDISTKGFMLVSKNPIEVNTEFHLTLELPVEYLSTDKISFKALSLYCKKDVNPDFYDTGFKFTDISMKNTEIINMLSNDYIFNH